MNALLLAALLAHAPLTAPDTTVELRRGDHVVVDNISGELTVEVWNRSVLQVGGDDDAGRWLAVSRSGSRVTLAPADPKRRRLEMDAVLHVPRWVSLEIRGRSLDVNVTGVEGDVSVQNVSGDIQLRGTSGRLSLATVEGEIEVRDARGAVRANSRGDDITLVNVTGDVDVSSGDGDLLLENVTASAVHAETLDGDVRFSGPLLDQGSYAFFVHDGDAVLELPPDAGAQVSVATFDGEFSSDFPVTLHGYKSNGVFDFTLGDGSARVEVKVFDGEIHFGRRPRR